MIKYTQFAGLDSIIGEKDAFKLALCISSGLMNTPFPEQVQLKLLGKDFPFQLIKDCHSQKCASELTQDQDLLGEYLSSTLVFIYTLSPDGFLLFERNLWSNWLSPENDFHQVYTQELVMLLSTQLPENVAKSWISEILLPVFLQADLNSLLFLKTRNLIQSICTIRPTTREYIDMKSLFVSTPNSGGDKGILELLVRASRIPTSRTTTEQIFLLSFSMWYHTYLN
jgi:hypothetical protein